MISIITTFLFFIYTYGIGFTLSYFIKNSENLDFFEKHIMRIGIGLGIMPILLVTIATLRIPVDWRILLIVALAYPIYCLIKQRGKIDLLGFKKNFNLNINIIILLVIFLFTLYTYEKGAFAYTWLEDDDPWAHARAIKYVSIEKTAFEPRAGENNFAYMDPYPPSYDLLLGILHQTSPSINWTIKFFNALIISLSILFFYYFATHFISSKNKALFATFVLAMIPCYMSHFIWAISLVIPVFFISLYSLEQIKYDSKWKFISAIIIASIFVIQPTTGAELIAMIGIYYLVSSFFQKKIFNNLLVAILIGLLISVAFWWGPILIKYRSDFLLNFGWDKGLNTATQSSEEGNVSKSYIGFLGSATRKYVFDDYFNAKPYNMINNPISVGKVLYILLILSLLYIILFLNKNIIKEDNKWILISSLWLAFTFFGLNGGTRWWAPIAFWSFRFWMLFAIAISLVCVGGTWFLISLGKRLHIHKAFIIIIVCLGIVFTSGYYKYTVNTQQWPPGGLLMESQGLLEGYLWFQKLPLGTKIYPMSAAENFIIGLDMFSCGWCKDNLDFRNQSYDYDDKQMEDWLKKQNYEYLVIDRFYVDDYGINKTNERLNMLTSSNKFSLVYKTESVFIFKVL